MLRVDIESVVQMIRLLQRVADRVETAVAFALLRALPGSAPAGTQSIAGALSFCIGFITTDALSGFFTAVILWIARRQDGLFEDQKHYLLRIQEAEKEERGEI